MDNFQQEIYKTIEIIAEKQIKQLGYDKTKKGFVTAVEDRLCQVRIDGDTFTCATVIGVDVEIGDVVFVKFPEDNNSEKYIESILHDPTGTIRLAMTPEQVLRALRMVDGAGSGLDADLLDGLHADELLDGENLITNINSAKGNIHISSSKVYIESEDRDLEGAFNDLKTNMQYDVEIISTNGNIFKNGVINTILIATVRKGREDVTPTIDANKFLWTRISEDKEGDLAWNVSHFGGTKQVHITGKDVQRRATFQCDILA